MDGTEAGHRPRAVATPPVVASVLSAGAGARLAVVAGLIALLWLAVWWALSP